MYLTLKHPNLSSSIFSIKIPVYQHAFVFSVRTFWTATKTLSEESVCVKRHKKLTSFNPFGIQFQHRRILHQHHHHLAFSWAQSFLARATATNYLLPESDAIWCEHISCKFNFYSRKGEQACLMPLHKPGNTWAKKWWRKKRKMLYTVQMKMSNHYTPATSTQV